MEFKFFSPHKEHPDPKINSRKKIVFGLFYLLIGLLILFAKEIGIKNFASGGAAVSPINLLLDFLSLSIGKWLTSLVFIILSVVFLISGAKEINKSL